MTNIWADTYKQIRDPFFKIEDPYTVSEEKKEKKEKESPKRWWDDDGDGKGYEKGEVEGKFKKKKKVEEEVEQIDEISLKTKIKAYAASRDVDADYSYGSKVHDQGDRIKKAIVKKHGEKAGEHAERSAETQNFGRGTPRAKPRIEKNRTYRTTKAGSMHGQDQAKLKSDLIKRRNEEYMDEAQVANRDPDKYETEEKKKYAPVRGERTPMPPRGNKKREDFEKWYAANVKEERDLVSKKEKIEKIDVNKTTKNKIDVNPRISEEIEEWIQTLIAEGYDLSKFTLDEVIHIYESVDVEQLDEGNSSTMPPRGDMEIVTKDPLQAAKARAARTKIAKERADLQVAQQAQRMKVSTTESVISYVRNHIDSAESFSEAVFNPKKSKMRPASERSERSMTDAQRKAAKKEDGRVAQIHSKGATVLQGLMPQGKPGKVKTTPDAKPAAPEANRKVKGKEDTLASKADKILKSLKNK
jgi:hypothetical protein